MPLSASVPQVIHHPLCLQDQCDTADVAICVLCEMGDDDKANVVYAQFFVSKFQRHFDSNLCCQHFLCQDHWVDMRASGGPQTVPDSQIPLPREAR